MAELIACKIDETQQVQKRRRLSRLDRMTVKALAPHSNIKLPKTLPGIRTQLLWFYDLPQAFWKAFQAKKLNDNIAPCVNYACIAPRRGPWKKIPMNIDDMIARWMQVIPQLALGHTKDDIDAAESRIEDLLTPLLDAPVKQIREFVPRLIDAMKADERVPFFIWRAFEVWKENFAKAPDEEVRSLKKQLATEIVDLVEEEVRPDIREAMIRALMWRDPLALEETKSAAIEAKRAGRRPRLAGRESCLFLQIPRGGEKDPQEIML